ncbi:MULTISPECIES: hypothetical protein [Halorussus]|uniref:hypothetical protein n=1 Tax=Halorussus TaxID=1070314 RepID=UPI00209F2D82|nr:hypothetical protein [Halorussus vallis]
MAGVSAGVAKRASKPPFSSTFCCAQERGFAAFLRWQNLDQKRFVTASAAAKGRRFDGSSARSLRSRENYWRCRSRQRYQPSRQSNPFFEESNVAIRGKIRFLSCT